MGDAEYWGTWKVTSEDGDVYFKSETTKVEADAKNFDFGLAKKIIKYNDIDETREKIQNGKFEIDDICRKAD